MNKFKRYLIFFLGLASCAIQQAPTGGPPDKTPPVILESYPANKTLNYTKDYVQFRFSKYMNKTSVIENLFVSPNKQVDFEWSGKDLELSFREPMDSNTTYSVTFGTDFTDLKSNKPEKSYSLIFSTGTNLDSGIIRGYVLNIKSSGTYVFAYYLNNINPDTLNPVHTKADYKTQVGSVGTFELVALKPGKYRLFAVNDIFKDGVIDDGIDDYGCSLYDINLDFTEVADVKLKTGPSVDTRGPILYTASAISSNHVVLEFSKSLDTASVNMANFKLTDSSESVVIGLKTAFLSLGSANKVELYTMDTLGSATKWRVKCNTELNGLKDSTGVVVKDSSSFSYFFGTEEKEDSKILLIGTSVKDSSQNISPHNYIEFYFNNSIGELKEIKAEFYQIDNQRISLNNKTLNPQDNIIRVMPEKKLEGDSWHEVILNLKNTTLDTSYIIRFKTKDINNLGGISGYISDTSGYKGQYILTIYSKEASDKQTLVTQDTTFQFESLTPGSYIIEISSDANTNSKYDYGNAYPWKPAEKLMVIPKDVVIKPRWKIEDFQLIYNGH
jgi:uncharacterized protein (DUF2141 family)